jgi:hypothetical protein
VGYLAPGWTIERIIGKWERAGIIQKGDVYMGNDTTLKPHMGFTKNQRTMWYHIHVKTREAAHALIRYYATHTEKIDGRDLTVSYYKKQRFNNTPDFSKTTAPTKYRPGNHYE